MIGVQNTISKCCGARAVFGYGQIRALSGDTFRPWTCTKCGNRCTAVRADYSEPAGPRRPTAPDVETYDSLEDVQPTGHGPPIGAELTEFDQKFFDRCGRFPCAVHRTCSKCGQECISTTVAPRDEVVCLGCSDSKSAVGELSDDDIERADRIAYHQLQSHLESRDEPDTLLDTGRLRDHEGNYYKPEVKGELAPGRIRTEIEWRDPDVELPEYGTRVVIVDDRLLANACFHRRPDAFGGDFFETEFAEYAATEISFWTPIDEIIGALFDGDEDD